MYTDRFKRNYRIIFFPTIVLMWVLFIMYWNKQSNNEKNFLKSLDLSLTLKVIKVVPTGNHGYGVIFGKIIKSNKPNNYSAVYQNEYPFCKFKENKVLFVSDFEVMQQNDSVIINSRIAKYWVYRDGKLMDEYNLTFTTDDFLNGDIEKTNTLIFNTYEKTH
jgi:hypothetical protein